ncbi:MAG: bifunctional tetrahydrofolate synthase/dihydrofolate synthase [Gammaproteobacteria bacterium]|nr:bifunctional tetrahydrofolate synthase/dihydrofolate synthase [Gammaproteobacteria bacterium]
MRLDNLADWLAYQETLNVNAIELGLERVKAVYERMQLAPQWGAVVTVAGTNGKGSCVAMLTSILTQCGYRVGSYTSPHLFRYNERICINGEPVDDDTLCTAFARVEDSRGDIALTYFEFGTLAALVIFAQASPDVVVLEVGLGGRLDAVNIIDPDVALITALDIDHVDWLGEDREQIGREKAGIMRYGKPMVCVDPDPPESLRAAAREIKAKPYFINQAFRHSKLDDSHWCWQWEDCASVHYPNPSLVGDFQLHNASGVLMVLQLLNNRLSLEQHCVAKGLEHTFIPGRFQVVPGAVNRVFDVAHNAQAAQALARNLSTMTCHGTTHAVIGMLKDKDIAAVAHTLQSVIDKWYVGGLNVARGAGADYVAEQVIQGVPHASGSIQTFDCIKSAYETAGQAAKPGDRIVVFGSFYTVAALLPRQQ